MTVIAAEEIKQDLAVDIKDLTIVHENVVNTYDRYSNYEIAAADSYCAATREYWAAVREEWASAIARGRGVYVEEAPENGAVTDPTLMGSPRIQDGEVQTAAAIA